jgi:hypothetical protein
MVKAGLLGAQPMTGESIARRLCREGRGGPEHDGRPAQAGWGVPNSHT